MTSPKKQPRGLSKVNQVPRGLQSLLGNVNQGMNPDELDNVISGQVDLLPFWASDKIRFERTTISAAAPTAASRANVTVPEGEVWVPIVVSALCTIRIGDIIRIGTVLRIPDGNFMSLGLPATSGPNTATNAEIIYAGGFVDQTLVLPAGHSFTAEIQASEVQTGTVSLTSSVLYYKLDI